MGQVLVPTTEGYCKCLQLFVDRQFRGDLPQASACAHESEYGAFVNEADGVLESVDQDALGLAGREEIV